MKKNESGTSNYPVIYIAFSKLNIHLFINQKLNYYEKNHFIRSGTFGFWRYWL